MTEPLTHSDSITMAAPANEVYAAISDITRMGDWSPQCKACWWDEGDGPHVGAFFTGRNESATRTWETRSQIVVAEPGRAFGWSVGPGFVNWIYRMNEIDGGTELTEEWEFTVAGQEMFAERYGDEAPSRIAHRAETARTGIPATLAAIKESLEH